MNYKLFNFTIQVARKLSTSRSNWIQVKNHYNSLGISSKATQADVKAAYYKLSMVYHPDKNKSDEAAHKFRDITEAYEVLANVKMRKLYDRGLFVGGAPFAANKDTTNKFYESRERRSRPPPPSGRTPIYDFDEWSKNHYGEQFARDMDLKRRRQAYQTRRQQDVNDVKSETIIFAIGIMFLLCMFIISSKSKYDTVQVGDVTIAYKKDKTD